VLSGLSNAEYGRSLSILSNASVGQHTRHIIEFFQTLNNGYESGIINYDKRERNSLLETNRDLAQQELSVILDGIFKVDKEIILMGSYSNEMLGEAEVKSTYYRELVYNLEHAIHHMAIIKIGIHQSTDILVPADFGVAPATIQFKNKISAS
jgi:hypothetical protein